MPTSPPPTSRRDPGFTLLEMLVVLVVLGIAATIAAGALSRKPGAVARDRVAERIRGAILAAQGKALETGAPQHLALSPLAGAGEQIAIVNGPAQGANELVIWPDGSVSGGRIMLDARPLVTVSWLTGAVDGAR